MSPLHDRETVVTWVVFLAGPVIWFSHFMLVYLVAEAGCTGAGQGLRAFDPPVPTIVTLVATAVAGAAALVFAVWGYRRWRENVQPSLALAGLLLSLLSFVTIVSIGLPAAFQTC